MGIIGGKIGISMLKAIAPDISPSDCSTLYEIDDELNHLFGSDFFCDIQGKSIIDFGCGRGYQSVELALRGAGEVIGIDIQDKWLTAGRKLAIEKQVEDRCIFAKFSNTLADIIICKDAFEHFANPGDMIELMAKMLKPNGFILIAFGPTWWHPFGGHLFSVFPWAHVIFTEYALTRWRSAFYSDGALKFSEVAGGLNQMTIRKFEKIVSESAFDIEWFKINPIKNLHFLKYRPFREFGSSLVRCKLVLKN